MSLSHRWLAPPAVPVSALRAWNRLRGTSVEAKNLVFTQNTSPGGAVLPLPGPTGPGEEEGKDFHPLPPVAVATGSSCVGPPGLEQDASHLCCSNTPHVYPQYQPRRGGTTSCRGRQAPGRKKDKSSILSHRWLSPPAVLVSALRAWNKLRGTSVEATNRMFTRNTSPGGAALPLPGPTGPREEEEQEFHPFPPVSVSALRA